MAAATLSILAAAAEDAPVLVIVDDAHWLDDPSRVSLIFAARRLGNEGIVVLFGMRDREWLADTGLQTLRLDGLAADAAGVLIDHTDVALDAGVRDRLITETRGNPLAIIEAVATLTEDERGGRVPIAHPLAVGATLERAFAQHLEDLPDETHRALVIAAASDTGDAREILAAMAAEGLSPDALEAAERADMITLARGRVEFSHPLVRSAAYHARDPADRREAHRALAAAVGGDDQGAWHRRPLPPGRMRRWRRGSRPVGPERWDAVHTRRRPERWRRRRRSARTRAAGCAGRFRPGGRWARRGARARGPDPRDGGRSGT